MGDVRRLRPQPYAVRTFAGELWAALRLVLPVLIFLVIGFSFMLLILASVLEKLGLPERVGEELITYGQFYAPLCVVYWIVKKDWLAMERSTPVLPVVGRAGSLTKR